MNRDIVLSGFGGYRKVNTYTSQYEYLGEALC